MAGQPNSNVALRRDLKVEPRYIEVRGNGSMTKTYCYKTCLTATSGSDTFMFYNTGRPHSGTWGSGYVTSQSGHSQMFVRRLSMPDAAAIQVCVLGDLLLYHYTGSHEYYEAHSTFSIQSSAL